MKNMASSPFYLIQYYTHFSDRSRKCREKKERFHIIQIEERALCIPFRSTNNNLYMPLVAVVRIHAHITKIALLDPILSVVTV